MKTRHFLTSFALILLVVAFCSSAFAACPEDVTLAEIIHTLPQRYDGSTSYSKVIRFQFQNSDASLSFYTLIVSNGSCEVQDGKTATPQLMISCPADIYRAIELGELTPLEAIQDGALQISDRALAKEFLQHFVFYYRTCH